MTTNNTAPVKSSNIFSQFWNWLTGKKNKRLAPPVETQSIPVPTEQSPEAIKQLQDNIDKEVSHFSKSLLLPEVEQDFLLSVKFMSNSGFNDGVCGIKTARDNEISVIAQSRSARLFKLADSILNGKLIAAGTRVKEKEELMNRWKDQDEHQHQYLSTLQYYRRHHPRRFNIAWSSMCVVIGILLILADLPLSIKLLETGFNFSSPAESILTAIGISVCTVFIKIYYDNYINVKYGGSPVAKLKYREMLRATLKPEEHDLQKEYTKADKQERVTKWAWHTGILLLTIAGIVMLGFFRVAAVKLDKTYDIPPTIYLLTFIYLTLIFPVISGICFSIGFTGFQNVRALAQTKSECVKSEEKFIQALQEYTTAQKEEEDIKSEMDKWKKDESMDTYKSILLSYYDYAYKLGLANPNVNKNKDLFSIAETWRAKAMTRKINNHIIKISSL